MLDRGSNLISELIIQIHAYQLNYVHVGKISHIKHIILGHYNMRVS